MRITKITESPMGTSTTEIDTEASPSLGAAVGDAVPRLPTHQEYQIIRDVLEIPEDPEAAQKLNAVRAAYDGPWDGSATERHNGDPSLLAHHPDCEQDHPEGTYCSTNRPVDEKAL